jgi:hypothetical protein
MTHHGFSNDLGKSHVVFPDRGSTVSVVEELFESCLQVDVGYIIRCGLIVVKIIN